MPVEQNPLAPYIAFGLLEHAAEDFVRAHLTAVFCLNLYRKLTTKILIEFGLIFSVNKSIKYVIY